MMEFIFVVIAMAVTDVIWAQYIAKVGDNKALSAGIWSALIILVGGSVTFAYVHDRKLIFAAALGAFLGTFVSVWWKARTYVKS